MFVINKNLSCYIYVYYYLYDARFLIWPSSIGLLYKIKAVNRKHLPSEGSTELSVQKGLSDIHPKLWPKEQMKFSISVERPEKWCSYTEMFQLRLRLGVS